MHSTAAENHTGIHSSQKKINCSEAVYHDLKAEMQIKAPQNHLPYYFSFEKTFGATCVAENGYIFYFSRI